MKRQLFYYILAAVCTATVLSCNKAPELDCIDPDGERDVFLTAEIGEYPDTRGVSISGEAITCTWSLDDKVDLVYQDEVIATLTVSSISNNRAYLVGKVRGAYPKNSQMTLYYGGVNHIYRNQNGTVLSAASRAYLSSPVKIVKQDNATLTLGNVTLKHQQAYCELSFRFGPDLINVRNLTVTGSAKIVKNRSLGQAPVYFSGSSDDCFSLTTSGADGLSTVYFAISDEGPDAAVTYTFTVTDTDGVVYSCHTKEMARPIQNGTYVSGEWILDKKAIDFTAPVANAILYDGNAHELVTAGILMDGENEAVGATIYYQLTASADESSLVDANWSTEIPQATDPGTYYVWYKVDGGEYYQDIPAACVPVTIAQRTTDPIAPTAIEGLVYIGSSQALVNPGILPEGPGATDMVMMYFVSTTAAPVPSADATGWSTDIPRGTDAGNYYIWWKVEGGTYYENVGVTAIAGDYVTIGQAVPSITPPTPVAGLEFIPGTNQDLVFAGTVPDGMVMKYYVKYSDLLPEESDYPDGTEGDSTAEPGWLTRVPRGQAYGDYYVWYKVDNVAADSNYAPVGVSGPIKVSIGKRQAAIVPPQPKEDLVYIEGDGTNNLQELIKVPGQVVDGDVILSTATDGITLKYLVTETNTRPLSTPDADWIVEPAAVKKADAKVYYIWTKAVAAAQSAYADVDVSLTAVVVVISKIPSQVVTPPAPAGDPLRYDGTAQALVTEGSVVGGTMKYAVAANATAAASATWTETVPERTEIGTYKVWYKVDADGNHLDYPITGPVEVTIAKGVTTVTIVNSSKSFPYTGSAQTLVAADDYTIANATDEEMTVQYATGTASAPTSAWSATAPTATNVADTPVYIWIKAVASTHYEEKISSACITATITPVTPVVSATLASDWEYDNAAHPLLTAASITPDLGTLQFNVGTSEDPADLDADAWIDTIPERTDAGSYYVFTRVVGDGSNVISVDPAYQGCVRVSGAPELTTDPTVNPADLVYDSTPKQLLTGGGSTSHGTLSYKAIKADSTPEMPSTSSDGWVAPFEDLTMTDAGNYYIYVKITGDATHCDKVFGPYGPKEIAKAAATLTCDSDPLSFTTAQGPGSTLEKTGVSCTGGTVTVVSATEANCTVSFSEGTITVTRVNTDAFTDSVITVSVTPDDNHTWDTANNVTFNVSAIKWSSLSGGDFHGFDHNSGDEQYNW